MKYIWNIFPAIIAILCIIVIGTWLLLPNNNLNSTTERVAQQVYLLDCNHIPKGNFKGTVGISEPGYLEFEVQGTTFTYSGNYMLLEE